MLSVQLTRADSSAAPPALLRFPAGLPHCVSDADETQFRVLQHAAPEKRAQRIVWADTDVVHYEAKNFGPKSHKKMSARKFAVGMFNADAQHVVLADADVFSMKQIVQGVDDIDPADYTNPSESATIGLKRRSLFDTFGSKKKQRQMKSVAASQVKPEDESSRGALHVALEESAQVESVAFAADSALNTSIFPAYNMQTKVLSEVYPVRGVIPDDVWELLEWHPFLKSIGEARDRYPLTVVELARRTGLKWKESSAAERERCGKAILFLFYLLRFAAGGFAAACGCTASASATPSGATDSVAGLSVAGSTTAGAS